jgi:hypothetical protein
MSVRISGGPVVWLAEAGFALAHAAMRLQTGRLPWLHSTSSPSRTRCFVLIDLFRKGSVNEIERMSGPSEPLFGSVVGL